MKATFALAASFVLVCSLHAQAEIRDGQLFDQGAAMTAPAATASGEMGQVAFLRGQWDVRATQYADGEATHSASALAATTYMNRGHAFLERFFCEDFDGQGHRRDTVIFLSQVPTTGAWNLGLADGWRENIRLYSGGFDGEALVVSTVLRVNGSGPLQQFELRLLPGSDDAFALEAWSGNLGAELAREWRREYTRRAESADFLAGAGIGEPAEGLVEPASEFDFLLGEWDEIHDMTFPNGQKAQWPANGSAVRILNGRAILEHGWYDVDPNQPDSATSIVRIYNRAMRRWESMYSTNRFNSVLYFGGSREGDEIILHSFDADVASGPISYWTFHSIERDSYGWYANTSNDRGATWAKTWTIRATRKGAS